MYEHPIKRAGLSLNRIIYSNTKMVMEGFPALKPQQFNLHFKHKTFEGGKQLHVQGKSSKFHLTNVAFAIAYRVHIRRPRRCPPCSFHEPTVSTLTNEDSFYDPKSTTDKTQRFTSTE